MTQPPVSPPLSATNQTKYREVEDALMNLRSIDSIIDITKDPRVGFLLRDFREVAHNRIGGLLQQIEDEEFRKAGPLMRARSEEHQDGP